MNMKQPHQTLTFGPCGLQGLDYWLEKNIGKKQAGSFDFSKHWKAETASKCKSSSLLLQPWIRSQPIKSTVDIQPTVRLVPKPLLLCSSGDVLHLIHHPRQHSWQSSSDNPKNIWWQLGNLQNTFLIYSKKVFLVFLCHIDAIASCLSFEVEGNNRHKCVVLVRQCARGDLSWSFHDLLQFQRQMCFHLIAVQINLAFHVLWSFTSNLLSSSAPSAPIILVEFPSKFRINRRWTSNSPRICDTLWARIGFDHCPDHPEVFLSSDAHFRISQGGNMHRRWQDLSGDIRSANAFRAILEVLLHGWAVGLLSLSGTESRRNSRPTATQFVARTSTEFQGEIVVLNHLLASVVRWWRQPWRLQWIESNKKIWW